MPTQNNSIVNSNLSKQIHDISDFTPNGEASKTSSEGMLYVHNATQEYFFVKKVYKQLLQSPVSVQGGMYFEVGILGLFVDFVFQLMLKGRAPEHWVIESNANIYPIRMGSRFLGGNFETFENILNKKTKIFSAEELVGRVKGIHRYLAAMILLYDNDKNFGNCGIMEITKNGNKQKVFAKIDHDFSFNTVFYGFEWFFHALKTHVKFDCYKAPQDVAIAENSLLLEQQIRSKIDFDKLLKRLDDVCNIIKNSRSEIYEHFFLREKQVISLWKNCRNSLEKKLTIFLRAI